MIDNYGRKLNYLRISITDRCNLRCLYCVSHTPSPKLHHDDILRYEEILKLVSIGVQHGITKVRITGGEPLIRKGVYSFLKDLTAIKGLKDVSLTSNGVFLKDNLKLLKEAGIKRINISLDSLKREKFRQITGFDKFYIVWNSILAAHEMGFSPIKLNVVPMQGINDDELEDFARLTLKYPFYVRFIEYMPIGTPELVVTRQLLSPEIKKRIACVGSLIPVEKNFNDGPAKRFRLENSKGEIGFISPVSNHFCDSCNRMRLTADGKLRPCLLSDKTIDIAGPLRQGCTDQGLYKIFHQAVALKGEKHKLKDNTSILDQMSSIGG